jgi:hypothetical protein
MTYLFPEFLNEGSHGPAVLVLQLMIIAKEGPNCPVLADGDYTIGGKTGDWVAALQGRHGLTQNRHFGPKTQKAFRHETGIYVNKIPTLSGETVVPEAGAESFAQ